MPKLTDSEEKALEKLSSRIFDVLFQDCDLIEEHADKIAREAMMLIRDMVRGQSDGYHPTRR